MAVQSIHMVLDRSWIESVYQLKLRELRAVAQSEFSVLLGEMRSQNRPGADLTLLSRSGGKLADDALARCEAAIPELVAAHVRAGDRNVAEIVDRIRTAFVDVLFPVLPGASLYASVGGPSAIAAALRLRQDEDSRFATRRTSLREAVRHYAVRSLGEAPEIAPSRSDTSNLQLGVATLAELYVASIGDLVTGKALRHRLRGVVEGLEARRALANSLVPKYASRGGAEEDDHFRPTLACLVEGLPRTTTLLDATLEFLRVKYDREGDFRIYKWEDLQAQCVAASIKRPFGREEAIQILSVAELSSGWFGAHWGAPRNLEALLEIRDSHALLAMTETRAVKRPSATEPPPAVSATGLGPFEVALSFPGDVRGCVDPLATLLAQQLGKEKIFYDKFYTSLLARPNLDVLLQDIYRKRSKLLVVFIGLGYQQREWCGIEWRAIREIIKSREDERVMLVRTDDAEVDGVFSIDGYVDMRKTSTDVLATFVGERLTSLKD